MTSDALSLNNKSVLITSGSGGVGLETAKQFCQLGATVIITANNDDKLYSALAHLPSKQAYSISGDIRSSQTAEKAMSFARKQTGRPEDILVNNAGKILRQPTSQTSDKDWQHFMDVNVSGVFFFSRAYANQTKGHGSIVNVSSTCAQVGAAGLAAYCASKGAVDQLTRSMALELAAQKISVNAVAPGAINSPMLYSKHSPESSDNSVVESNVSAIPIGVIAEPQEIARAIIFLATQPHITGSILSIDGGYTAQ